MITVLDRYVARTYLRSLFWTVCLIVMLFLIVDAIQDAGHFLDGLEAIWSHYALRVPVVFVMGLPFSCVIAAAFTVSQLERGSELLPQKVAGIPIQRSLAPIFAVALIAGLGGSALQEWVFPLLEGYAKDVGTDEGLLKPPPLLIEDETVAFLRYDPSRDSASWVVVTRPLADGGREELFAAALTWCPAETAWLASDGRWTRALPEREPDLQLFDSTLVRLAVRPENIRNASLRAVDLTTGFHPATFLHLDELWALMRADKANASLRVLLYDRLSYPLVCLILCLVGVPLALARENRAAVLGLLMGLGTCAVYFLASFVCRDLSLRGWLPPEAAVGLPLAAFGAIGLINLQDAPT